MSYAVKDMVHGFRIPHDKAICPGDSIIVRVPQPPEKLGAVIMPDMARDITQHNVVAGKIVKMGPIAFTFKDIDGKPSRMDVEPGDWAIFRPSAGTFIQPDGRVGAVGGVRYLSSFRDIIGVLKNADMAEANATIAREDEINALEAAKG